MIDRADAKARNDVLTGMIYVAQIPVYALFDSGAICSFISARFVGAHGLGSLESCRVPVTLPSGAVVESFWEWPKAEISVRGRTFYNDLIVIELAEFDIILGMDW